MGQDGCDVREEEPEGKSLPGVANNPNTASFARCARLLKREKFHEGSHMQRRALRCASFVSLQGDSHGLNKPRTEARFPLARRTFPW